MFALLSNEENLTFGDLEFARRMAEWIEFVAVVAISIAVVTAVVGAVIGASRTGWNSAFDTFKRYIARGLLVGLDLLIAADVIKTVTLEPTLENAIVLGFLVIIRTFLSWALVLEIEGRWPWQRALSRDEGRG